MIKEKCMTSRSTTVLVGVASLFAGLAIPVANAQQVSGPVRVVQLTGLAGVKDNAKGTLSVFRTKIDTLTVQYRDADGGLHGAIFTMPVGTSEVIKKELVAQGAHTTSDKESAAASAASSSTPNKEQK